MFAVGLFLELIQCHHFVSLIDKFDLIIIYLGCIFTLLRVLVIISNKMIIYNYALLKSNINDTFYVRKLEHFNIIYFHPYLYAIVALHCNSMYSLNTTIQYCYWVHSQELFWFIHIFYLWFAFNYILHFGGSFLLCIKLFLSIFKMTVMNYFSFLLVWIYVFVFILESCFNYLQNYMLMLFCLFFLFICIYPSTPVQWNINLLCFGLYSFY